MSSEKEATKLIYEVLLEIRADLKETRADIARLETALVEHADSEGARFDRFEAALAAHGSRLKTIESRANNGTY